MRGAAAASGKGRPPSGLASRAKCRGVQSAVARGQGTAASIAQAASLPFGFGLAPCAFCRSASRPRQPAPPRPFCSALRSASGGRLGGLRPPFFSPACPPSFCSFGLRCFGVAFFSPFSPRSLSPLGKERARCILQGLRAPTAFGRGSPGVFRQALHFLIVAAESRLPGGFGLDFAAPLFSAQGLDKSEHLRYYDRAVHVPVLRDPSTLGSPWRCNKSGPKGSGFFCAPCTGFFTDHSATRFFQSRCPAIFFSRVYFP